METQQPCKKASEILIPAPASLVDLEGVFALTSKTTIVFAKRFENEAATAAVGLSGILGFPAPLPIREETGGPEERGNQIRLRRVEGWEQGPEAYRLAVSPALISIEAGGPDGAWWALEDIRQIALAEGPQIPCFASEDAPRFAWRGLMLDCSRHFFTVNFLKKLIDAASLLHLNRFHWHLTDDQGWRLPVDGYPLLTEIGAYRERLEEPPSKTKYGGFYTHRQIRELVAFAAARHVMIIPEIETPGHASALLASYPSLGCGGGPYEVENRWGIFSDVLCAGNDETLKLLDAAFKTLASLFPAPYIHFGGDECPRTKWELCPRCQKRVREEGLGSSDALQSWMTVQTARLIEKYGRRAIGWDEVLDGTERLGLSKNLIVMSWRGNEGGLRASQMGHQVIMCPQTAGCYLDFKHIDSPEEPGCRSVATVERSYGFDPVVEGMDERQRKLVLGGQGNLWTEEVLFSKAAEYMFFPRLAALSEALWTPKARKDFTDFARRIPALETMLEKLEFCFYKGPLSEPS